MNDWLSSDYLWLLTGCAAGVVTVVTAIIVAAHRRNRGATASHGVKEPDVVELVKPMIGNLSGCMNLLLSVSKGGATRETETLFANLDQIFTAHGSEQARQWFVEFTADRQKWMPDECRGKAAKLLDVFSACGPEMNHDETLVWTPSDDARYMKMGKVAEGDRCQVVAHFWTLQGEVFERGVVTPRVE